MGCCRRRPYRVIFLSLFSSSSYPSRCLLCPVAGSRVGREEGWSVGWLPVMMKVKPHPHQSPSVLLTPPDSGPTQSIFVRPPLPRPRRVRNSRHVPSSCFCNRGTTSANYFARNSELLYHTCLVFLKVRNKTYSYENFVSDKNGRIPFHPLLLRV